MVDEEHPTTKSDSKQHEFTYEKPNDTIIFGNDKPKRKQKMRNLDEKPIERRESQMSNHAFWAFLIIAISLAIFFVWAFNNVTNLSPPL